MHGGKGVRPGLEPGIGKQCQVAEVKAASWCWKKNAFLNERLSVKKNDWDRTRATNNRTSRKLTMRGVPLHILPLHGLLLPTRVDGIDGA